ncbi:hypothetical protein ACFWUZ_35540 [Streptomyces sp. NPDC058646]|uniref:hypothetical protein n=1 Tax=Streptomyces sp. NPDC058646 TaxID=3346574 RepID=UPI00364E7754
MTMNTNLVQAIALVAATILILPVPVAVLAGWAPPGLPVRTAAIPYAWAMLCLYATAPLNTLPRILHAAPTAVTSCTAASAMLNAASIVCLIRAARLTK